MTVLRVPYHLDEYLPGLDIPVQADRDITASLPGDGDVWARLAALYAAVADAVAAAARRAECPVVVSGDCTTSLGIMAGLQHAGIDAGIVWLDAHGDVQTLETTSSGYLGGLPLRLLAGYRPDLIATRLRLRPVAEQQITLVGARDLDPPEVSYLASAAIRRAEVSGVSPAVIPDGPVYLHVDLDVIDSRDVPGLRFPAPGGPDPAAVAGALRVALGTGRVAAVGVACTWYPGHDAAAHLGRPISLALTG